MTVRMLLRLATATAMALVLVPAASAQEDPTLQIDDILPGVCEPNPVVVGQHTDCRFPLARDVEPDPLGGPLVADVDVAYDEDNDERADCAIEDGELVCRAVPTYYPAGTTGVSIQVGWLGSTGVLAEITTLDYWDVPVSISTVGATEPYTTAHRPLEIWIDQWEDPELFVKVRQRDGGAEVAILPVPEFVAYEDSILVDVSSLAPGRYWLQPCLPRGEDPSLCEEGPGAVFFQVGSGELVEAIPGWNRVGGDRINLVLAGTGFEDFEAFAETATTMLGFDGAMLIDVDGEIVDEDEFVEFVEFGPFATEPIRSRRERFNLWLLTDLLGDSHAMFWTSPPNGLGFGEGGSVLPDAQVTAIELLPVGQWSGSEAGWPSFTGVEPGPPDRTDLQFAGAYVAVPRWNPLLEADTLTHELGHAVFDLRDEYALFDRSTEWGYPNCAPDMETAEKWWGHLVGDLDPFLDEYIETLDEHGLFFGDRVEMAASLTVGYSRGGCYGDLDTDEAVRPTGESIMHSQTPVFGSVNRSRVEEILGLWSGRDIVRSSADLDISCARSETDPWSVSCDGVLAPYVDAPEDGLVMASSGALDGCAATSADGDEPVIVTCGPVAVDGYESVEVDISNVAGVLAAFTVPQIEVTAPRVALGLGGAPPVALDPVGEASLGVIFLIVGGGLLSLAVAGAVVWRRSRTSKA